MAVFSWERDRGLAPYVRLVASPSLRTLCINPPSTKFYVPCTPTDAQNICDLVSPFRSPSAPLLLALSLFPEDRNGARRGQVLESLTAACAGLSSLSVSAWLLSLDTMRMLAGLSLRSLLVQGRCPIDNGDLSGLALLDLPPTAFQELRRLSINNMQFGDVLDLLATPRLLDCVKLLRVELAQVQSVGDDEHALYQRLIQLITGSQTITGLTLVARQEAREGPYRLAQGMFDSLALRSRFYTHFRLYNFSLPFTTGFGVFHEGQDRWRNLTQLSVMDQDLCPADLIAFASFPSLSRLSANISATLGLPHDQAPNRTFNCPLTLTSRFAFREPYLGLSYQRQALGRIAWDLCPNGLDLVVERNLSARTAQAKEDHRWLVKLTTGLKSLGLIAGFELP
ncbi:hypothetical protein FRC09_008646 [Ceratobasidium sp. 395]|nr:hypothetical protein FRC09_008646 [Ceratobasidium sp. 395]